MDTLEAVAVKIAGRKAEGLKYIKPKLMPACSGDRVSADCGFHSLQYTFMSLCAAGGVSQSVVQSLVGHGSPAMTQHYTHIALETAQNAVALLPDVTHRDAEEDAKSAEGAKLETVLGLLDALSAEGLEAVTA